MTISSCNFWKS